MTTDLHPLTTEIIESHPNGQFGLDDLDKADWIAALDEIVRARLDPKVEVIESGVRFTGLEDFETQVAATFIESGNQMQMAIIGTEPVLLVQPNFDADENVVTMILTAVDLPPKGLIEVLELLLDGARTIVRQQDEMALAED